MPPRSGIFQLASTQGHESVQLPFDIFCRFANKLLDLWRQLNYLVVEDSVGLEVISLHRN